MTDRRRSVTVLALTVLALLACREPESRPEDVARELFDLARERPRDVQRVDALFGLAVDDPRRPALGDTLDLLAAAAVPRVTDVQTMSDLGRTAVDLFAELPGGGIARYSIQLEAVENGWRVRWIQGPGLAWPPARRSRDLGLSNSTPPR